MSHHALYASHKNLKLITFSNFPWFLICPMNPKDRKVRFIPHPPETVGCQSISNFFACITWMPNNIFITWQKRPIQILLSHAYPSQKLAEISHLVPVSHQFWSVRLDGYGYCVILCQRINFHKISSLDSMTKPRIVLIQMQQKKLGYKTVRNWKQHGMMPEKQATFLCTRVESTDIFYSPSPNNRKQTRLRKR